MYYNSEKCIDKIIYHNNKKRTNKIKYYKQIIKQNLRY